MALTGDRYPLHCSAEYARSLGYRRETVNDLLVFHMVFGKTVNDVSLNAVANLGYAGVRFLQPVYPGDTVRSVPKCSARRKTRAARTASSGFAPTGTNQRGEKVLEFYRWVMVNKRDPKTPTGANDNPGVPKEVPATELYVPEGLDPSTSTSRGRPAASAFFEDYEKGERIDHIDGMTIEESEHAIATRLYQNTAKVHFDGFAAEEHALRQAAHLRRAHHQPRAVARFQRPRERARHPRVERRRHANPTFAGDTIYAWSEVLDKAEITGRTDVGALRLRLVGVKNHDSKAEPFPLKVEKDGKSAYHPNVVLDLDYWVLIPKKR